MSVNDVSEWCQWMMSVNDVSEALKHGGYMCAQQQCHAFLTVLSDSLPSFISYTVVGQNSFRVCPSEEEAIVMLFQNGAAVSPALASQLMVSLTIIPFEGANVFYEVNASQALATPVTVRCEGTYATFSESFRFVDEGATMHLVLWGFPKNILMRNVFQSLQASLHCHLPYPGNNYMSRNTIDKLRLAVLGSIFGKCVITRKHPSVWYYKRYHINSISWQNCSDR